MVLIAFPACGVEFVPNRNISFRELARFIPAHRLGFFKSGHSSHSISNFGTALKEWANSEIFKIKMLGFPTTTKHEKKCSVTYGTMGHLDPKQPPVKRKPFAAILSQHFVQKASQATNLKLITNYKSNRRNFFSLKSCMR